MNVSPETWNSLSQLLDEALDLEPAARARWLDQVGRTKPELVASLRRLLDAHAASQTQDLLATLPALDGTVHLVSQPGFAADDRVGPYVLLRLLGSGGMADVWLAGRDDGALSREVALKLPLMSWLRQDLAVRFARERDILARLEHPHIARLYDAGVSASGLPYLAMEYVDGQPLNVWCDERRLSVPERIRLFAQVLAAVQFAHANLVIHRDLKPSNILVTGEGQVRLLDFGIAKLLEGDAAAPETELTRFTGRALTPLYASPEQIQGGTLTTVSDVYSLGVVLFELLAGASPYRLKLESVAQLEEAIVSGDPARPSASVTPEAAAFRGVPMPRLERQLTGDLDTIVLKALEKAPDQRYGTVAALAEDLERHLDGQPVHAQPPSAWYRLQKFVTRHRWPVVGSAVAISAILAVATVAVAQARRARTQQLVAQSEARKATAVKDFLVEILGVADPASSSGKSPRELTVQEAVDQAAVRIGPALAGQPDVQMAVLETLSSVYSSLDRPERAVTVLKDALALSEQHDGIPHRHQAEFLAGLANTEMFAGHYDESRRWLDRADLSFQALGDTSSLAFAHALKIRGNLDRRGTNANYPRSISTLERAAELFRTRYPTDEGRLGTLFYLAQALRSSGNFERAEAIADEAVSLSAASKRPGFDMPNSYSLRAAMREVNGDLKGADSDYEIAGAAYEKAVGPTHFLSLQNSGLHGFALMEMGERDRGLKLVEASATELGKLRAGSNTHAAALDRLGAAQLLVGQVDRAISTLEQSRELWATRHDELVRSEATLKLATARISLGQAGEARALLEEALAIREKHPDAAFLPIAEVHLGLGLLALEQQDTALARRWLEQTLSQSSGTSRADLHRRVMAESALARLALREGNVPEALTASERSVAAAESERLRQFPMVTANALEARGTAWCGAGRAAEGEVLLAQAVALSTAGLEASSPQLLGATLARADCLILLGRAHEARTLADSASRALGVEINGKSPLARSLQVTLAKLSARPGD